MTTIPVPSGLPLDDLGALIAHIGPEKAEGLLHRLPPDYEALFGRAVGRVVGANWRANPASMGHHLTRGRFRRWRYVELLGDAFRRAVLGESTRQIWNLPARMGKSNLGSQWGPVWAFDRDPTIKLALTSYGDELADENATIVRDLLIEHAAELQVRLRRDRRRSDRFVTDQGGGLIAAGVGSGLTGFGAHGIVVDDPFKNWQEAHSPARRALVWNWYRSVVRTRLETGASFVIVVMTRWHEDDLAGMLEAADTAGDGEGWEVIRLPAIAETPNPNSPVPSLRLVDPLGRKPGAVIEPERFSLVDVQKRAAALGSYLCTPAETPVLMHDWTTRPISTIREGDEIVGFVQTPGRKVRHEPAKVLSVTKLDAQVMTYRMASGRVIRATRDHRWMQRAGRPYRPANIGTPLRHICEVDESLTPRQVQLLQYLAGIIDGEGCVKSGSCNIVQAVPRNAPVADRIMEVLDELGIAYNRRSRKGFTERDSDQVSIDLRGVGRVYRLLLRYTVFAKRAQAVTALYDGTGRMERHMDRVLSIEPGPIETVYALETATGNYVAWGYASANSAGMEQQRPAPEEGGEIMRAWWRWVDVAPPRFDDALTSWDTKWKDTGGGDFVVGQVWGRVGPAFYCVDSIRGQFNLVTTRAAIALMAVRHPKVRRHIIENTGNGPEVMAAFRKADPNYRLSPEIIGELGITEAEVPLVEAVFRRGLPGLLGETPKGDKAARLRAQTPLIEAGNVYLLSRPWAEGLVNEAAAFPNAAHDDQVDALSQGLRRLSRGEASAAAPSGQTKAPAPGAKATKKARSGGSLLTPRARPVRPRRGL